MRYLAPLVLAAVMSVTSLPSEAAPDETCTRIVATGHPDYPIMAFKRGDRIKGAAPLLIAEIATELKVPFDS
uniref:hypothetical protein n=1 Tax=Methyloceanibacter sp. TaxID=1965321 RepID=UPI0035665301